MVLATEYVVTTAPFTVRRTVKWGHCDPAGVVYTVVFGEYVISTAELFYQHLFQKGAQRQSQRTFGTPTRALTFDFQHSLWPGDKFDTEVHIGRIGEHTYELLMEATNQEGKTVFTACLTPICVAPNERRAIAIPSNFRAKLQSYKQQCAG